MAMFLSLLLLICSVSAAQLNTESDNEVISHSLQTESKGEEPARTLNNQESCTPDIHAVLREMSATLAGLKYEIRDLQRENEVQAALVKELDKVKTQQQVQAAKVTELELQLTGELVTIKTTVNITENHVDALRREGEGRKVAFSASLLASGSGYAGPFNTHTPLVFRNVVTNTGNAYNPQTGLFTAPVRGVYHFEMHIHGHANPSHASAAALMKNGEHIFIAWESQSSYALQASNGATLLLEVGDVVFLRLWENARIYDSENHPTTFSGHLLFIM